MKQAYIIHAWDETPQSCWYPWLKQELESRGYQVFVPAMPNPEAPEMQAWVKTLTSLVVDPNQDTLLIGHSIGCQTILRYLAQLPEGTQVGGAVFVAPWMHLTNLGPDSQKIAKPWLETPIDWQAAKAHCPKFTALFSDDDQWVPLTEEKLFQEKLGAGTKLLHGLGHFDGVAELPELLEEILKGAPQV